jgi:hypothetical protein
MITVRACGCAGKLRKRGNDWKTTQKLGMLSTVRASVRAEDHLKLVIIYPVSVLTLAPAGCGDVGVGVGAGAGSVGGDA